MVITMNCHLFLPYTKMVFNCIDVKWMKNIKIRVNYDFQESGSVGGHVSEMVFINQIMRLVYDPTQLRKPYEGARKNYIDWLTLKKMNFKPCPEFERR